MRADRLVSILLLLQNSGKLTTKQLAQELEVSGRTIHRDMEALSAAGIPIVAERGKLGGWQLLDRYRTTLTGLKKSELQSLFIGPSDQLLADLNLAGEWNDARRKLIAALPASYRQEYEGIWNRVHIDTSAWKQPAEKIQTFQTVQEAIWEERKLDIVYEKPEGRSVRRVISPLGLVAKGSTWYIAALSEGELRTYRASRLKAAVLLEEPFQRPDGFNLAAYWKQSAASFVSQLPTYETEVKLAPSAARRLTFTGRFVQVLKMEAPVEEGWVPATLSFDGEQEAAETLLGFGDRVQIIRPAQLRQKVYEMAKAAVAMLEREMDR